METSNHSQTIADICAALQHDSREDATTLIRRQYPFHKAVAVNRTYTAFEATCLFIRDGFIDRYSGQRLVFTPVLRVISHLFPTEFPYHTNWKLSACHMAYGELLRFQIVANGNGAQAVAVPEPEPIIEPEPAPKKRGGRPKKTA